MAIILITPIDVPPFELPFRGHAPSNNKNHRFHKIKKSGISACPLIPFEDREGRKEDKREVDYALLTL